MSEIGRIREIWRYPVSSLGGERIASLAIGAAGPVGDRQFALIDGETRLPAVPEKDPRWRKALHLQAMSVAGDLPLIVFPDGHRRSVGDTQLNALLSDYFGFAVAVAAHDRIDGGHDFPSAQHRHVHFAVHLLTTSSLQQLAALRRDDAIDVRRFRPTVLIEADGIGFVESTWIGRKIQLGGVELSAREETKRCGVTLISQPGLAEDPEILRSILRHNRRNLGIYCTVERAGMIEAGEGVVVTDPPG